MSGGNADSGEPNLTPILDMVFQLITFFMLVANFKAAAMDLKMTLPVVASARAVDTGKNKDVVVLNINKDGKMTDYGRPIGNIEEYVAAQARSSRLFARRSIPDLKDDDDLPTLVVVRADQATRFETLNKVIKACQDNGYRNFALRAMNRKAGE